MFTFFAQKPIFLRIRDPTLTAEAVNKAVAAVLSSKYNARSYSMMRSRCGLLKNITILWGFFKRNRSPTGV